MENELHYVVDNQGIDLVCVPGDHEKAQELNLPIVFSRDRQAEMETRARTQGYTLLVDDTIQMHEDVM